MERYSKEPIEAKKDNRISIFSHRFQQQRPHIKIVAVISDANNCLRSGHRKTIEIGN